MSTKIDLENMLDWSDPKELETKFGTRILRKAEPDDEFWQAWRANKEALKALGISVSKDQRTGSWEVCWWQDLPREVKQQRAQAVEASKATDVDEEIPAPAGLQYFPFQKAGIAYARTRKHVLIADEPGLGKTIQALGVINCTPDARRVLVVCPASVKLNWAREAQKWLVQPWTIHVVHGRAGGVLPEEAERLLVIVNYDVLSAHLDALDEVEWDVLVVDEAHYIRNTSTQRSKAVRSLEARRTVYLTGTPLVNNPMDVYPLVAPCGDERLGYRRFRSRYVFCDQNVRSERLREMQRILRETCMVRRMKKDVLTELPAKTRQIVVLEPRTSAQKAAIRREEETMAAREAELVDLRLRVELARAESEAAYREAVEQLERASRISFEEIARARHETALAKVPDVIAHLEDLLEQVEKVVVWAHHHDVIDHLVDAARERGWNPVVLTGDSSAADRQAAVDTFQNDKNCRVFIGNLRAGGIGITLTAASHVVVVELPWTAEAMTQAEDRCHRIGQRDNVLVQHIVLDGSIDVRMANAIVEKQAMADAALDDPIKSEPVIPISESAATQTLTLKAIAEQEAHITPEQIAAIHEALRLLAGADVDHAVLSNDVGFNKIDTAIGHSLAARPLLTPRQAVVGRKLVARYRRQLPEALLERCGINAK